MKIAVVLKGSIIAIRELIATKANPRKFILILEKGLQEGDIRFATFLKKKSFHVLNDRKINRFLNPGKDMALDLYRIVDYQIKLIRSFFLLKFNPQNPKTPKPKTMFAFNQILINIL
jgi:hypothetical protein